LTIVFRYGAQHDLDQHARCRSTATDIWKLALTARPPTWPGLGANTSQRDPDAPTDAEVSALRPALRGGRGGQLGENWARPQARGPSGKRKGPGRFGRRIKRMDDQKRVHALQSPTRTARRQSTAQEP